MKHLLLLIIICAVSAVSALEVSEQSMRFRFDEKSGQKTLSHNNDTLKLSDVEITLEGEAQALKLQPRSWHWDPAKRLFTQDYAAGELNVRESIRFSQGFVSRQAELRVASDLQQPLKLKNVAFPAVITFKGSYLMPASDYGNGSIFDPEMKAPLATLKNGGELFHPNNAFAPLLLESENHSAWLFINNGSHDRCASGLTRKNEQITVVQRFNAAGWLEPGILQTVGHADVASVSGNLADAQEKLPAAWFAIHGFIPPPDRPEWIQDLLIYSFHPLGTLWSGLKDLGGFTPAKDELLPQIKRLGFNLIWLLPLEDQWIYWPRDYFKFMKGLENTESYHEFISAAQQSDIKVIQDIVPHGGSPSGGKLRGNSPFSLIFDKDGKVPGYWCFDFGDKAWQQYIQSVADFYMRNYQLAGFRIDAINGNPSLNWKRPGHPTQRPGNVDIEWWNAAMEKHQNTVPGLDYPRASMGMRAGAMEMMSAIRETVKKSRPDGFTFAETNAPIAIKYADLIYDSAFNHHTVHKMLEMPISAFASGYMVRMEEQQQADPPGLIRMRCIDNHDTTNLIAFHGLAAWKALHASIFAIPGVPMLYHEKEVFQGPFIAKLAELRRKLPELRRGSAAYNSIPQNSPGLFQVLREYQGNVTLAVINFSPDKMQTELKLPDELDQAYPVKRELLSGQDFNGKLTLAPWQAAFITMRALPEQLPEVQALYTQIPIAASASANIPPVISRRQDLIRVDAKEYSAEFSAINGMMLNMSTQNATIIERAAFSSDGINPIPAQSAEVHINGNTITCSTVDLQWRWICLPDGIRLDFNRPERNDAALYLVFPVAQASRWQVACAEGRIDDFQITRHRHGKPGVMPGYRLRGSNVVWNSETMPLSVTTPSILAENPHGSAVFTLLDFPERRPVNIKTLDRFATDDTFHLALALREPPPIPPLQQLPGGDFSLFLQVGIERLQSLPDSFPVVKLPGGLELSHNSLEWIVRGKFGEITLRRIGGTIREWKDPAGKTILKNATLYPDKGFGRKKSSASRSAYPHADSESGSTMFFENGMFVMRFFGQLRDRGCWKAIEDPIFFINEYAFAPDGDIHCRISFNSSSAPMLPKAFLAWRANLPEVGSFTVDAQARQPMKTRGQGRSNIWEPPLPQSLSLDGNDNRFALHSISASGPAAPKMFFDNHNIFFAWLDGSTAAFHPGKTYSLNFSLRVEKP